jgi:chromosomal replication initiation ATPase DnaA
VEQVCGETRRTWQEHRGGDGKALAMWATRRYGGLTLRETGEAFGGLDYAAVSIAIRRLERKAATATSLRKQYVVLVDRNDYL